MTHAPALSALAALAIASVSRAQLPPPPVPPQNPITAEKAVLGKILFWDEQLSSENSVACGTCHIPSAGGSEPRSGPGAIHPGPDESFGTPDDIFGSPGVINADAQDEFEPHELFGFEPQVTGRWAPTFLASPYFTELFWDGRADSTFVDPETGLTSIPVGGGLESQAVGPLVSDAEMAHEARDWSQITAKLANVTPLKLASNPTPDIVTALGLNPTYPDLFQAAFGSPAITAERIAFALATYQRMLIPDQTPFDLGTLNTQEQQGFNLFNLRNCNICHTPPLFSNDTFRNIGVRPPGEDLGRQNVTGNPADRGRFKVPTLRNAGLRERFFHNGSQPNLAGVVAFYSRGGDFGNNQDPLITPFPAMGNPAIVAFLTNGLTDARVAAELPPFDRPTLSSENPFPNPNLLGTGVAGSGGIAPAMIAIGPPSIDTPEAKIGVGSGLGGALAYLVLSPPGGFGPRAERIGGLGSSPLLHVEAVLTLEGRGPGAGFATHHLAIESLPAWAGPVVHARWYVFDPGAASGIAKSEVAELTLF